MVCVGEIESPSEASETPTLSIELYAQILYIYAYYAIKMVVTAGIEPAHSNLMRIVLYQLS
jgi:hypothetical protein